MNWSTKQLPVQNRYCLQFHKANRISKTVLSIVIIGPFEKDRIGHASRPGVPTTSRRLFHLPSTKTHLRRL